MIVLENEKYLTPQESAEFTGRSVSTIYQRWKVYGWNPYNYGSSLLFRLSDIENWLSNQIKAGTPKNGARII